MIDLVALPLGTAMWLRCWQGLFGIHDPLFITIWTAAVVCEMARRVVDARRRGERPSMMCQERRLDFMAAILLGIGPVPIAASLNDRSPLGVAWHALPVPEWVGLAVAMAILGIAVQRLAATVGPERRRDTRRIRDLGAVPGVHIATLVAVAPNGKGRILFSTPRH